MTDDALPKHADVPDDHVRHDITVELVHPRDWTPVQVARAVSSRFGFDTDATAAAEQAARAQAATADIFGLFLMRVAMQLTGADLEPDGEKSGIGDHLPDSEKSGIGIMRDPDAYSTRNHLPYGFRPDDPGNSRRLSAASVWDEGLWLGFTTDDHYSCREVVAFAHQGAAESWATERKTNRILVGPIGLPDDVPLFRVAPIPATYELRPITERRTSGTA